MSKNKIHFILTYCIAAVWLINGLFCKVLNFVPRHEQIVSRILGEENGRVLTMLIGLSEIAMACWIVSNYKKKLNAVLQIVIVATMNTIEFILAHDLLLWGKLNAVFAFVFISIVYVNEFYLIKPKLA